MLPSNDKLLRELSGPPIDETMLSELRSALQTYYHSPKNKFNNSWAVDANILYTLISTNWNGSVPTPQNIHNTIRQGTEIRMVDARLKQITYIKELIDKYKAFSNADPAHNEPATKLLELVEFFASKVISTSRAWTATLTFGFSEYIMWDSQLHGTLIGLTEKWKKSYNLESITTTTTAKP